MNDDFNEKNNKQKFSAKKNRTKLEIKSRHVRTARSLRDCG